MGVKLTGILFFQAIAIILNFLPIALSSLHIHSIAKCFPSSFLASSLQASIVIFIPSILDVICEINGCYAGKVRIMNIIILAFVILPNIVLLLLLSNMQSESSKLTQICLSLVFFNSMTTVAGIYMFSSKFFKVANSCILSAIIVPSVCVAIGLNCLSHAVLGENLISLILSLSLIFLCLGLCGIFKSCHIIYIRKQTIDPIKFHCFTVCMAALLILVLGIMILRIASLLSTDGMIVYLNGIPILCTICLLPVFLLDGRVMRHKAARNEVFPKIINSQ